MNPNKQEVKDNAFSHCLTLLVCVQTGFLVLLVGGGLITHYCLDYGIVSWQFGVYALMLFLFQFQVIAPYFLVRAFIMPLRKIKVASQELARGNLDVTTEYDGDIVEIKSVFENFNIMAKELRGIATLRSDFVSNVSHEFKTPLATIEGYATYLQDPTLSESERQECIDLILDGTRKLSSLVGDILMISKLENDNYKIEPKTYRLDEQINQILLLFSSEWEKKEIEFDLQIEEITYAGAKELLERVWANLIGNAVKYSEEGGHVRISLKRAENQIVFEVQDAGVGISEEVLPHIFEKFYQADTKHKSEGNGLGLAQVKQILDKTGNSITVKSELGKGSTFTVTLEQGSLC